MKRMQGSCSHSAFLYFFSEVITKYKVVALQRAFVGSLVR